VNILLPVLIGNLCASQLNNNLMNRSFLAALSIAALTMSNDVNAQQGFSISIKSNPQFSFLHNKDDNDISMLDRKATFNSSFGLGAGYNFTKRLGVGMDVLYSLQGQRYNVNGFEIKQKVNYVKVPVYFSYNGDQTKNVSFIGKIGPQISILTHSKLRDKNGDNINMDTKDRYNDFTFGGMAAAGAQFKLNKKLFLTTAARFDYDFTDAEDDSYRFYTSGRAKTYNMTTGLEVGLKYLLQ
jgi:hypothetical protein